MTNEMPESVVQRQVEAYNTHDIDAFVATYAPDAAYIELATNQVAFAGHDAFRQRFGDLFIQHPHVHVEIKNRITLGQHVVDHEEITGRQDISVRHAVVTYEVKDNLIQRAWIIRG